MGIAIIEELKIRFQAKVECRIFALWPTLSVHVSIGPN